MKRWMIILLTTILLAGCSNSTTNKKNEQEKTTKTVIEKRDIKVKVVPSESKKCKEVETVINFNGQELRTSGNNLVIFDSKSQFDDIENKNIVTKYEAAKQKVVILYVIGGIAILAGIIATVLVSPKIGIPVALGGVGLILFMTFADTAPWWVIAIVVLIVLAFAGYWLYREHSTNKKQITLTTITEAIEEKGGGVKEWLKTLETKKPKLYNLIKGEISKIKKIG